MNSRLFLCLCLATFTVACHQGSHAVHKASRSPADPTLLKGADGDSTDTDQPADSATSNTSPTEPRSGARTNAPVAATTVFNDEFENAVKELSPHLSALKVLQCDFTTATENNEEYLSDFHCEDSTAKDNQIKQIDDFLKASSEFCNRYEGAIFETDDLDTAAAPVIQRVQDMARLARVESERLKMGVRPLAQSGFDFGGDGGDISQGSGH